MKQILTILALMVSVAVRGQFASPFDFPLLLSANFGELRPNHFHGGIDIKTGGVVGKRIYSIGDGFVSRVLVQHGGFGQAIFIEHPNGLTSVYGHIIEFAPEVQEFVRSVQYENESFTIDVNIEPERFPVKQGDLIAISGNEGSSAGPHLHLELRRTDSGNYVDPLPYFKDLINDTKAPVINHVGFYPVKGKGLINGSSKKRIVTPASLNQAVTAWGEIYTAISANDYMDGTQNKYGVRKVTLYVDEEEVFNSETDEVARSENRMINGFIDYEDYSLNRRLMMRSHVLPGINIGILHTGESRGIVTIDEERDYKFRYELEDEYGNRKTCRFTVKGVREEIPEYVPNANNMLYTDKNNVIQEPGMELIVPKGYVYEDTELETEVKGDSSGISFDYKLDMGRNPLHDFCWLAIEIRNYPIQDMRKYYIAQKSGGRKYSVGGSYKDGWIEAKVRQLGTFTVAIDTIPPRVSPISLNAGSLSFKVSDEETGIYNYKVYIDGEYVVFGLKGSTLKLVDKERVKRGTPHTAEVVLTDGCGNETRKRFKF